jgi:ribonuclease E
MPRYRSRVKLYDHTDPLFSHYGIENQVSDTLRREVKLKGGGSIVIDPLEALVAIDVNSSRATAGENIEETAFQTNLEAAEEIGRQLRLRDLGGLIVIDFIDMVDRKNKAAIERKIRELAEQDKARIEVGKLSKFGLLEMSRQRLRASLSSQTHAKCSSCNGSGYIRIPDLVALEALRKIQSAVIVGGVKLVKARLNPSAALFLLNNKRNEIVSLENIHGSRILILPDGRLKGDEFEFEFEGGIKKEENFNTSLVVRNQNESKRQNEKNSNQRKDSPRRSSSRLRLKKSGEEKSILQEKDVKINKNDEQQNNTDLINKRQNIESS